MDLRLCCRALALGFCFLTSGLALTQQPEFDYTADAIPLSKALSELSKISGTKLLASDGLATEPIVMRLKHVTPKEVMDRLAVEFVADWVPTKEGLQLTQTAESTAAFQKGLAARRLAAFQKSMEDLVPIMKSPPMEETEAQRIAIAYTKMLVEERSNSYIGNSTATRITLSNRTADMRLLAAMVMAIGAEKLSALSAGKHVFSLDPTSVETRIENFDTTMVDQYVSQRNMLAKALEASKRDDAYDGYGNTAMFSAQKMARGPVRPLIEVESDPDSEGVWLYLQVYDNDGTYLASVDYQLGNILKPAQFMVERAKAAAASRNELEINLPPPNAELVTRYSGREPVVAPLSSDASNFLMHPEEKDPFSIAFSKILIEQSERENRNLIATAGDSQMLFPRLVGKNQVKASIYETSLTGFMQVRYERPEGWLLVHATNPIKSSSLRLKREAIGDFVRAWFNNGYLSIEDWAQLATEMKPNDPGLLPIFYWNMLKGERGMAYENDWNALRLYGSLSNDQVGQLSAGRSLVFHTLSPEQQDDLRRLVYESGSLMPRSNEVVDPRDNSGSKHLTGIDTQPFESVPNGIPPDSVLTAKTDKKTQLFVRGGLESNIEREMDLNQIASMLVQDQDGPPRGPREDFKIQTVRIGTIRTITFDLALSDRIQMESQLREDHFAPGDPIPVAQLKDRLPKDVWDKLEMQMKKVRELRKNMGPLPEDPPPPTAPPA